MISTGLVESWRETPANWGPLYPFVGYETAMLAVCVAFCVGFLVWKFRDEHVRYGHEVGNLRAAEDQGEEC